ncbi:TetR/AcrR family transcriptional regulator [Lactobacillus corticis]|uniref:TetR family transcriptional regulator n=1 Tax=Lactobacillus corticis TaxID=2201249 RepID=A0A916QFC8_9LACO|nr:TetR/AcrR family transcriptional regulator [Lactobacillus corticis]GFZ26261.1 TetR family transcriptional regulator [Lactobacillus corticis]
MKREAKKAANRAKIIQAAKELIKKQGIKNTNVRQIAELSGISYVTMYKMFQDKKAVIRAAIMSAIDDEQHKFELFLAKREKLEVVLRRHEPFFKRAHRECSSAVLQEIILYVRQDQVLNEYFRTAQLTIWRQFLDKQRQAGVIKTNAANESIITMLTALEEYAGAHQQTLERDGGLWRDWQQIMMYGLVERSFADKLKED